MLYLEARLGAGTGRWPLRTGSFVIGSSVIVGLVVFLILIVIQFVVITNGATRVAEVAAPPPPEHAARDRFVPLRHVPALVEGASRARRARVASDIGQIIDRALDLYVDFPSQERVFRGLALPVGEHVVEGPGIAVPALVAVEAGFEPVTDDRLAVRGCRPGDRAVDLVTLGLTPIDVPAKMSSSSVAAIPAVTVSVPQTGSGPGR